jgi:preprotein translocase subunit YajC
MDNLWILAQAESGEGPSGISSEPVSTEETTTTTTTAEPNVPAGKKQPPGLLGRPLLVFGLMFIMMYLLLFRGPRKKQQQQHKQMVQDLQKNDKIRTIGGIIGTVVDIKDGEITLKVDESNNTKIKVTPSAIGTNLSKDKK